jgi:hypothetical protein
MKILAVISARGGSKEVPRKNLLKLGDKPLIAHMLEKAKKCDLIDMVICSTDSPEIASVAKRILPSTQSAKTLNLPPLVSNRDNVNTMSTSHPFLKMFRSIYRGIKTLQYIDKQTYLHLYKCVSDELIIRGSSVRARPAPLLKDFYIDKPNLTASIFLQTHMI